MDLGTISIKSNTEEVQGRWKGQESKKVWVQQFIIVMEKLGMKYSNSFEVAESFDLRVIFEKLNPSPLMTDNFISEQIDFTQLDISYKISLVFSPLIMHLKQEVYTYLLRCNDLNFNYTDSLAKYFQLAIWNNGEDTQKYIKNEDKIVKMFRNKEVVKMKFYLQFPSLSLQIHNKENYFLSELVLWNANLDFIKYVDYRKTIILKSHTLYVLHSPHHELQIEKQIKQVAIAPVNSSNFVKTDRDFYNFEVEKFIQKLSPNKLFKAKQKFSKSNFVVNMHLEPDGEKLIQIKIEKLKIFIKPHIYLMIFEHFVYGMPQYKDDSKDKPNFYDSDWGNAPKMEVCCQILQSLLCFESDEKVQKTIACQGNTSFTYIREKMNLIKKKLIEQPLLQGIATDDNQSQQRRGSQQYTAPFPAVDSSSTFKLMQVSISDLCPFFCSQSDLNGKNFKQVRKREMMSPFTLFYNRNDIIELVKLNERLYASSPDRFVFRKYCKVEANLERTLLKISFQDIKILLGICDHIGFMLNQEYMRLTQESSQQKPRHPGQQIKPNPAPSRTQTFTNPRNKNTFALQELRHKSARLKLPKINFEENKHHSQPGGDQINQDENQSESSEESFKSDSASEEDEYLDDEEMKRVEYKLKTQKEQIRQKQQRLSNFRDSVRRTSMAINLIQEKYSERNSKQDSISKIDEDIAFQYDHTHAIQQLQSINKQEESKFKGESEDIIEEAEENEEFDDVDEGSRAVMANASLDIINQESPFASKNRQSDSQSQTLVLDNLIVTQIKEERGVDQFQIVSYGLKILMINDSLQNFFPVLGISLSEFHFSLDQNETQKAGSTQFSSAINFYNAQAGEWEPFIETFRIHFTIMEEYTSKKRILQCELPSNLCINFTQKFVENISNTYKSWQNSQQVDQLEDNIEVTYRKSETLQTKQPPQAAVFSSSFYEDDESSLREEDDELMLMSDRGGTNNSKKKLSSYDDYFDDDEDYDQNERAEEDVVTPYSICNQTNVKLLIKRLNTQGENNNISQEKKHKNHQGLFVKGGVGSNMSKLNRVYVINPNQTIDYAVDYELQVKQQMSMYNSHQFSGQQGEFIKILFADSGPNRSTGDLIQNSHGMSIPLSQVNLNQIGCKKHYFKDDERHEQSEFYIYGVTQVNMKKVLTIRTQYLFVNQTFFSYDIHIRFRSSSIVQTLSPGDKFPIPNLYNQCKFQIRVTPNEEETTTTTDQRLLSSTSIRTKKPGVFGLMKGVDSQSLKPKVKIDTMEQQYTRQDVSNFQEISKSWSDMLQVNSLKVKLPLNKATFLKHGKTFTIIKKEAAYFQDAYDIILRPPLLLKNCLPLPVLIEYEDSNGESDRIDLQKQEEKHIFVFNLQQPVMLKLFIEGFQSSMIILDCSNDKDLEIKVTIFDSKGRSLDMYVASSAKEAGKKAIFYVKNLVINNTQQNLTFYYTQPNENQIQTKLCKGQIAGQPQSSGESQFFMLSDVILSFQLFRDTKFMPQWRALSKYLTLQTFLTLVAKISLCLKKINICLSIPIKLKSSLHVSIMVMIDLAIDDYIYTKVTTIAPLYVIINQTSSGLQVAQKDALDQTMIIPQNGREQFHWADKNKQKLIAVKIYQGGATNIQDIFIDFEWSCGFSISEVGSLSIQNREKNNQSEEVKELRDYKQQVKYLRIERRLHKNTLFIVIEEDSANQPYYKIENISKIFNIRYWQLGFQNSFDSLKAGDSSLFAWSDCHSEHKIQIELITEYFGNRKVISGAPLIFHLDLLNYKQVINVPLSSKDTVQFHICTFTDGFTKVIRFSDIESYHITATNQSLIKEIIEDENSLSIQMFDLYVRLILLIIYQVKQICLSVIGEEKELFTMYFQGIQAKTVDKDKDRQLEFKIGFMQCDNQSENDPIFPVLIKPKYIKPDPSINSSSHSSDLDDDSNSTMRTNPNNFNYRQGVFELYLDFRRNIPHVLYFELIEYLVQTLEVKLEFSHFLIVSKFLSNIGRMLNQNLTFMHSIFENDDENNMELQNENVSPETKRCFPKKPDDEPQFLRDAQSKLKSKQQDTSMKQMQLFEKKDENPMKKQKTIASSLQLLKTTSIKNHRSNTFEEASSGTNSPKKMNSLKKQQTLQQQLIIDKIRQQETLIQDVRLHKDDWKEEEFKIQSKRIYIKEYRGSPLELEISVMNKATFEVDEGSDIFKTISSLGLVISSIDEAPIKLNALILENVFGDQDDVIEQLKNHHMERLKQNLFKFIGASNLLGNPMNFVSSLGTGVQEFFYHPRQGFIKGPIEGGIGILKGTTSLMKNTFIGTIGSASKIASTVSKGLLVLSNDREYIQRRDIENIRKKPKNMMQGLNQGLKQALSSVTSGLTGVVSQPIEETKKGGIFGFLKGTAQGMAGLVIKPISGTLDLFSSTSEGIKNTQKSEQELEQDRRLRLPRPFYEFDKTIREYDDFHAFWINLIPKLNPNISTEFFFEACLLECTDVSWSILFLTLNQLSLIVHEQNMIKDSKSSPIKIKWVYETSKIRYVEVLDDQLLSIGFEQCSINLQLGDQYIADRVKSQIQKIMKYMNK